jgi:hypothetical protein
MLHTRQSSLGNHDYLRKLGATPVEYGEAWPTASDRSRPAAWMPPWTRRGAVPCLHLST